MGRFDLMSVASCEVNSMSMSEKRGFTLVELLVVIAIIALLMSILMPALSRVKKQARSAACKMNLHQWSLIWTLYCSDNDDRFCYATRASDGRGWPRGRWILALRSQYNTKSDILRCPMATKPPVGMGIEQYGGPLSTYRMGRDGGIVLEDKCSYGANCWIYNPRPEDRVRGVIQDRPVEWNWITPSAKNAAGVPVFADSMWRGGGPVSGDSAESVSGMGIERSYPPLNDGYWDGAKGEMRHFCIDRHNQRINMLFMDWHVREVGLKELWTLKWHKEFNTAGPWTLGGGVIRRDWPEWMQSFKDY